MTLKQKFVIGVGAILCVGIGFGSCYYLMLEGLKSTTMSGYVNRKDLNLKDGEVCLQDDSAKSGSHTYMKNAMVSAKLGYRLDLRNNFATEGDLLIMPDGSRYKSTWRSLYNKDWIMMYNTYMTKLSQNWLLKDLKYYLIYDNNQEDIGCFDLQKIE